MSLAIQINLNKSEALNGTSVLPAPSSGGAVTKTVDTEGVVVLEVDASTSFGVFEPGSLLGSKSADFVLQSLQVSSAGEVGVGLTRSPCSDRRRPAGRRRALCLTR